VSFHRELPLARRKRRPTPPRSQPASQSASGRHPAQRWESRRAAAAVTPRRSMRSERALARLGLALLLPHLLLPAAAYNPFSAGAPPTLEMVRTACEAEVETCEVDCNNGRQAALDAEDAAAAEAEAEAETPLSDNELDHLIELNRPAAQVKAAMRRVSLTKSQIEQLLALEERTPGVYGNRMVVKNMLRDKTPSDKYRPKRYCCGEMLRAVLNSSYPLSRIPGAVLPAPIQPVVQCFVPGLAEVEAQKALRKTAKRKAAAAETADGERAPDSATSPEKRERAEEAPERSAKAVEAERQRTIVDDVKCGMCGHVVEDLWTYAGSHAHSLTHTHTRPSSFLRLRALCPAARALCTTSALPAASLAAVEPTRGSTLLQADDRHSCLPNSVANLAVDPAQDGRAASDQGRPRTWRRPGR
jgi:hypothetical protein